MKFFNLSLVTAFITLSACGLAGAGEECSTDADCADGLHCHLHEGEADHGECEAEEGDEHDDHDGEDHDDHDDE